MRAIYVYACVLALLGLSGVPSEADGAQMNTLILPSGLYVNKTVVSLREARYTNIVPQRFDLSCAAAALATILKYYYNHPVDELEIIKEMLDLGDKEQIAKRGFSLLDLKKYAEAHNYSANGYRVALTNLDKLRIPSIILLKVGRYTHFVVLKGVWGNQVYIADPAFGNRAMAVGDFAKSWNDVVFLVVSPEGEGGTELPLQATPAAPTMSVMTIRELGMGSFSFFQRLPGEF
jgi:predicted double-glycine peptidase